MEGEAENTQDRMARARGKGSFKQITIFCLWSWERKAWWNMCTLTGKFISRFNAIEFLLKAEKQNVVVVSIVVYEFAFVKIMLIKARCEIAHNDQTCWAARAISYDNGCTDKTIKFTLGSYYFLSFMLNNFDFILELSLFELMLDNFDFILELSISSRKTIPNLNGS